MTRWNKIIQHRNALFVALLAVSLTSITVIFPCQLHARATTVINVLDEPGEGFNDPGAPDAASEAGGNTAATLGDQRYIAFAYAAAIWSDWLDSSETIIVGATFDPLPCNDSSANLGATGTNTVHRDFQGAPVSNTWYPAALANSIAGTDLAPVDDDINAVFNSVIGDTCSFPKAWYYGLDGDPPADTIDFVSIALHELGHGLGFQTFVNLATGARLNNFNDAFMLWLEDHATGNLYADMTDIERVSASINTGNLHWVGPDVVNESGALVSGRDPNGHVEMYAPDPLDPGSSVSHFSTSLSSNELMKPTFTGATHDLGLAAALMQDIGWFTALHPASTPDQTTAASSSGGGGSGCFITTVSLGASPANPQESSRSIRRLEQQLSFSLFWLF